MSPTLRQLITDYVARVSSATRWEEVAWGQLAGTLRVRETDIQEMVEGLGERERGKLWDEAMQKRISQVLSHKLFRQQTWERTEHKALEVLEGLLASGRIKDPNTLLAIAKMSAGMNNTAPLAHQPQNPHTHHINIAFGPGAGLEGGAAQNRSSSGEEGEEDMDGMNRLPSGGQIMRIDLSPRTAAAMARVDHIAQKGNRIIDSDRLSVKDLRTINLESQPSGLEEDESDV